MIIPSTNQRTACVAPTYGTLSDCSVPQRRSTEKKVRLSTAQYTYFGTPPTFGGGNANCTALNSTEPHQTSQQTSQWKRAITHQAVPPPMLAFTTKSQLCSFDCEKDVDSQLMMTIFSMVTMKKGRGSMATLTRTAVTMKTAMMRTRLPITRSF